MEPLKVQLFESVQLLPNIKILQHSVPKKNLSRSFQVFSIAFDPTSESFLSFCLLSHILLLLKTLFLFTLLCVSLTVFLHHSISPFS